jgi:hypothetical protein
MSVIVGLGDRYGFDRRDLSGICAALMFAVVAGAVVGR